MLLFFKEAPNEKIYSISDFVDGFDLNKLNANYIGFLNSRIILIEYLWNNFINLKIDATPCICRGTQLKSTQNKF